MSEWRQLRAYCGNCATWSETIPHLACAAGARESAISLDADEFLLTCGTCHEVWLIEDTEAACPTCGRVQAIELRDDLIRLRAEDQLLAADGAVVYILLQSGSLLITHRGCIRAGGA